MFSSIAHKTKFWSFAHKRFCVVCALNCAQILVVRTLDCAQFLLHPFPNLAATLLSAQLCMHRVLHTFLFSLPVECIAVTVRPTLLNSGIRLGLQWKLRTLDKPFDFFVLKPSGVRFAEVSFRNYLVNWGYMAGFGIRIIFIWVRYSWGCG